MELQLNGKLALITGGSKGIGRGVAELLAREGCHLHLAARTQADLEKAKRELEQSHSVEVAIHPIDLSRSENCRALAKAADGIDILVNCAGAIRAGNIEMVDEQTWMEGWNLKLLGSINLTREIYPAMCRRGSGVIVNVIGNAGERPVANYICGSLGNAALIALTKALGAESLDHGVRVVGVSPGQIATERLERQQRIKSQQVLGDPDRWREMLKNMPQGRPGTVEECASVVVFLASPCAGWVSGSVLTVDGGMHARA
jgi:NAD(P)-dependent dehydrogenase (short-subunit alcohol dehydrogenase family)